MEPVRYSQANQALVDAFTCLDPADMKPAYWGDDAVTSVRKQAKDHYIFAQNRKCCYCKREYPTGNNAVWDGEHIIPRSKAVKFLFEPRNLAAACKDCNIAKGEDEVRVNPQRVSFPDQSQHYLIVHPHFDEYEDHIRWYGEVVRPLTDKGIKLTQMCNLHRFGLLKVGEKVLPINSHADNIVGKFMDPHASPLELDMALAAFTVYVKSVPQA
ncbi:HNH endonuclease [Methylorubrum salsuginis]|uniref:HNH endonuclease n=1 Tax=Methylorubrum salsuginis TaxID=414703 RepID=UPI000DF21065|nr:HNH endonuclease [Methylorubrum salsuginis]